jgi:hypothetical protein
MRQAHYREGTTQRQNKSFLTDQWAILREQFAHLAEHHDQSMVVV